MLRMQLLYICAYVRMIYNRCIPGMLCMYVTFSYVCYVMFVCMYVCIFVFTFVCMCICNVCVYVSMYVCMSILLRLLHMFSLCMNAMFVNIDVCVQIHV